MKPSRLMEYEWMIKYTPQKEWIEGKGILLYLAFYFSEIGAGIYFVSLFLDFRPGWLLGWLVSLVLGGLIHLAYLGKPTRSWRILLKPTSSELSRGLWFLLLLAVIGFFQVVPIVIPILPWTGNNVFFKVIVGIICILLITHGFLTMNIVRALPMWNSSLMIPLSMVSGIWVGAQTAALMTFHSEGNMIVAEIWARWSIIGFTAVFMMFLLGLSHTSENTRLSLKNMLRGDSSVSFYIGVIIIGLIVPLTISVSLWEKDVSALSSGILFLRFICVLIGDLMMRYNIMKNALYTPLI